MPGICDCPRCVRFRENNPPTLTYKSAQAIIKANQPSNKSRRARIEAGVGKSGKIVVEQKVEKEEETDD